MLAVFYHNLKNLKKKNYYVERQGTLYTYSSFMEIFKKQRSSIQKIYVTTQGYTTASFTSKFSWIQTHCSLR